MWALIHSPPHFPRLKTMKVSWQAQHCWILGSLSLERRWWVELSCSCFSHYHAHTVKGPISYCSSKKALLFKFHHRLWSGAKLTFSTCPVGPQLSWGTMAMFGSVLWMTKKLPSQRAKQTDLPWRIHLPKRWVGRCCVTIGTGENGSEEGSRGAGLFSSSWGRNVRDRFLDNYSLRRTILN